GKNAGLEFSDPIPTLRLRQARVTCQITLEPKLIELVIIEGAKSRGQAAKGSEEAELRFDVVDDAAARNPLHKPEATLGFTLHVDQLIPCYQPVLDQVVAANTRVGHVTYFVCDIESAMHQIAAGPDMPHPRQDDVAETIIGSSLKTLQSAFFDQI